MSVQFAVQTSQGRSKALTAERLINLYAEQSPDQAKSPFVIHGTPGFSQFAIIGQGPIRAMHDLAGVLYIVSGAELYSVDSSGIGTLRGTIAGTGRAFTADNGTQLVIVNDTGTGFVWDGATLSTITDPDFQLASSCAFINQFIVFSVKGSGQFFWSAVLDAKNYAALDFATAESNPDNLVEILSSANLLWMFGEKTIEVFYNSGSSAVFERVTGAPMQLGATANTIVSLDNSPFWQGDDGIFYRANGYVPIRISTYQIEFLVKDFTNPRAFRYVDEGHRFYVVSYDQGAVAYDTTTGLWHERDSFAVGRYRPCCHVKIYGKQLVGDYLLGLISTMSLDTYADGANPLQRRAVTPFIHDNGRKISLGSIQIAFEHGVGISGPPVTEFYEELLFDESGNPLLDEDGDQLILELSRLAQPQGTDPQAMLDWTDDGEVYGNELWRPIGKIGERTARAKWNRMGSFRNRAFRVTVSDPVKIAIIGTNL